MFMRQQGENSRARTELREAVASISPVDAREQREIQETLDWIDSGVELYRLAKPATPAKHLVVYAAVIDPSASSVYLLHHRKALMWLPPGGHVEPGEGTLSAVEREAREELGLPLRAASDLPLMISVDVTVGVVEPHTDVSLWYAFISPLEQVLTPDLDECFEACWFDTTALTAIETTMHVERFLKKVRTLL
jgi:8-oxo-dGTP pyrophosphatase MutT (NUDIX family)